MTFIHPVLQDSFTEVPTSSLLWICAYVGVLLVLTFFGCHRFFLVVLYYLNKRRAPQPPKPLEEVPVVTIQLPVYNELYVVDRLIESVCALDYPRDRLEIQVLDDSTDETLEIARRKVEEKRAQGFDISHLHRPDRTGYKAGALHHGMGQARGEFLAIFDADFVPRSDFLKSTLSHFSDARVAAVQTRWEHLNRDYSTLTRVQAMLLDAHFMMEHTARNRSGRFINFNGTAGIWRRAAIEDAGGWQGDTLTEDLDLSMRVQSRNWKMVYLPHVTTPGELPVEVNSFKIQQHRWTKGAVQTTKKLLWTVLRSPVPLKAKVEAAIHLSANFSYVFVVLLGLLMLPATVARGEHGQLGSAWIDWGTFGGGFLSVVAFYVATNWELGKGWFGRILYLPHLFALGFGLSLANAIGVIEALINHRSSFLRTPKYNIETKKDTFVGRKYRGDLRALLPVLEFIMAVYFGVTIYVAYQFRMTISIPFCAVFMAGFLYMGFLSVFQGRLTAR
jgi:cellulose synthase/poly-beta-1,6-N-acetylglucosamine synthase-like glycosyltransferase